MNLNIYNPYVRQELELYHHGILGQRWGKKNGPPYPLSASAHSSSEKKAGWKKSLYADGKSTHFSRKVEKAVAKGESKGFNARRGQRTLNLIERQKAKDTRLKRIAERKGNNENVAISEKRIKAGERKANEILKNLNDGGYTIGSAKVLRDASYGKHLAFRNLAVGGALGYALMSAHSHATGMTNVVEGNRYKVKGGRSGERFARKLADPNSAAAKGPDRNSLRYNVQREYAAIGGPSVINRLSRYSRVNPTDSTRLKKNGKKVSKDINRSIDRNIDKSSKADINLLETSVSRATDRAIEQDRRQRKLYSNTAKRFGISTESGATSGQITKAIKSTYGKDVAKALGNSSARLAKAEQNLQDAYRTYNTYKDSAVAMTRNNVQAGLERAKENYAKVKRQEDDLVNNIYRRANGR